MSAGGAGRWECHGTIDDEVERGGCGYRYTFMLCLIGRSKVHNFWYGSDLAWPNLIMGLGRHDLICGPYLGLKSSPRAGLTRLI
jgi:hypothetical protein